MHCRRIRGTCFLAECSDDVAAVGGIRRRLDCHPWNRLECAAARRRSGEAHKKQTRCAEWLVQVEHLGQESCIQGGQAIHPGRPVWNSSSLFSAIDAGQRYRCRSGQMASASAEHWIAPTAITQLFSMNRALAPLQLTASNLKAEYSALAPGHLPNRGRRPVCGSASAAPRVHRGAGLGSTRRASRAGCMGRVHPIPRPRT
jgi:hypothetical protein